MNKWRGSWPVALLVATASPTTGTWSIVAINKRTNQIGSAMATCLDSDRFPDDARNFLDHGFLAVPFEGGIVAQANIQDETGPAATVGLPMLLHGGRADATSIVSAMTSPESDPGSVSYQTQDGDITYPLNELRQYGVVTYNETSPVASYTGPQLTPLYNAFGFANTEETSLSSMMDDYIVSVQGNIVFPGTVEATLAAFEGSDAADDFAERLFGALKAGFLATGGDVRCDYNPKLKGAVLSWLKVMESDNDGTYSIDFEAEFGESEERSALDSIEEQLLASQREEGEGSVVGGLSTPNATSSETPSANVGQEDSTQEEVTSQSSEEEQPDPPVSSANQSRMRAAIAIGFGVCWAMFG